MRRWWLKSIPVVLVGWAIPPIAMQIPGYGANIGIGLAMLVYLVLLSQIGGFWWRRAGGQAIGTFFMCVAGPLAIFFPFFMSDGEFAGIVHLFLFICLSVIVAPISALLIYFLVKPDPDDESVSSGTS
jgi:hypothetical protein